MQYGYPIVWSARLLNHLSKTKKLNGVYSWSLEAGKTCPGSWKVDPDDPSKMILVDVCAGCYAKGGCYVFGVVKNVRADNKLAWQCGDWVDVMVEKLAGMEYFRWFDSGDCYCEALAEKIYEVIVRTPNTMHWFPTRSYKIPKIRKVLEQIKLLHNASVRYSSDEVDGSFIDGLHGSCVGPDTGKNNSKVFVCPATKNHGNCNGCTACYNKDIKVIKYIPHGRGMEKVIKNKL